jgi:hypothetical protein
MTTDVIVAIAYFNNVLPKASSLSTMFVPYYCKNTINDYAKDFMKFHFSRNPQDISDDFYEFIFDNFRKVAQKNYETCCYGCAVDVISTLVGDMLSNLANGATNMLVSEKDKGLYMFNKAHTDGKAFRVFYTSLKNDQQLKDHIFKGFTSKIPNTQGDIIYNVVGVHHKKAFTDKTTGFVEGDVKFKNYKTVAPINGQTPYKCKVEMYYPALLTFPNSFGWKASKDYKSFFPNDWSEDKIFEEIAIAFQNKVLMSTNSDGNQVYTGDCSVGWKIQIIWNPATNKIISAFPN